MLVARIPSLAPTPILYLGPWTGICTRGRKMAEDSATEVKKTLGVTRLTMSLMELIAPGAFLWLTFFIQASTGLTAPAMWLGIFVALLLCLATAVAYAELSKLS